MNHSSKIKNAAVKQVLGAVAMLNDKHGTTTQDIIYVLDSIHDKRVQRPAVQSALRIALRKGLLVCLGSRYKLQRQKKHMERGKASQLHRAVNRRFDHSKSLKSRDPHRYARSKRCHSRKKFAQSIPFKNNDFEDNDSLLQSACSNSVTDSGQSSSEAGSEPQPTRKRTNRSAKEKHTQVISAANYKKNVPSVSFKQNQGKKENGNKNQKRRKDVNEQRELERAETSARVQRVSKKLPVDLGKCQAPVKRSRYNLRPRSSFKPQELPSSSKELRKRIKQEKDDNSPRAENKTGSKVEKKDSDSDNNGDNNRYT